jgi:hypothetical protein
MNRLLCGLWVEFQLCRFLLPTGFVGRIMQEEARYRAPSSDAGT